MGRLNSEKIEEFFFFWTHNSKTGTNSDKSKAAATAGPQMSSPLVWDSGCHGGDERLKVGPLLYLHAGQATVCAITQSGTKRGRDEREGEGEGRRGEMAVV